MVSKFNKKILILVLTYFSVQMSHADCAQNKIVTNEDGKKINLAIARKLGFDGKADDIEAVKHIKSTLAKVTKENLSDIFKINKNTEFDESDLSTATFYSWFLTTFKKLLADNQIHLVQGISNKAPDKEGRPYNGTQKYQLMVNFSGAIENLLNNSSALALFKQSCGNSKVGIGPDNKDLVSTLFKELFTVEHTFSDGRVGYLVNLNAVNGLCKFVNGELFGEGKAIVQKKLPTTLKYVEFISFIMLAYGCGYQLFVGDTNSIALVSTFILYGLTILVVNGLVHCCY